MSAECDGALEALRGAESLERLRRKLIRLAWRRYRISETEAEDVVQTTFMTYLEVRDRYPVASEHAAILVGIFRKKCLTHIDGSVRESRRLHRYCTTADAARENPWIRPRFPAQTPSVLDDLVRRESRGDIRRALAKLRPNAREIVSLMVWSGLRRKDVIERLSLNANTFDSRLHACRAQLRGLLRKTVRSC